METKKGKLIILSAPSGCGKTTVSSHLIEDPMITKSVSATTRAPRPGEKDGIDYFFISNHEFQKKISENKFVEYAEYHNNFYGTPIGPIKESLLQGLSCLLIIEVKGALQIKQKYPDSISIFLLPPSIEVLKSRLIGRDTDASHDIAKRLDIAAEEIKEKDKYDYCIVNEDLDTTVGTILSIIKR